MTTDETIDTNFAHAVDATLELPPAEREQMLREMRATIAAWLDALDKDSDDDE